MDRTYLERISVRTALGLGFCATVSLWIYTGYSFALTMNVVRDDAAIVTARYNQAQQLLATIRTQVLLSSVRVRDALLTPDRVGVAMKREEVEESYRVITMAIEDYEPVVRTAAESDQTGLLRAELERFHVASANVLGEAAGRSPAEIRDVLNRYLMPPREAALLISEEIQALNRQAYIRQQSDIASIYRAAELKSRQQLGIALALSLGVLLLTNAYAGKLDSRLRMQLKRYVRLSGELHDTATKPVDPQAEDGRTVAPELTGQVGRLLDAITIELSSARRAAECGGDAMTPIVEAQAIVGRALQIIRTLEK